SDETLVPILVKNITQDVTKSGDNPGTPYFKVRGVCMAKEPTFIRKRVKRKKQKGTGAAEEVVDTDKAGEVDENGEPVRKGTTIKTGDEFLV
ncbi:hypothetical protein GUF51_00750, partial [Xanthomonas citri pv. citri]|nr:hypothetical protein [Xanthomonas citri pv. citri]